MNVFRPIHFVLPLLVPTALVGCTKPDPAPAPVASSSAVPTSRPTASAPATAAQPVLGGVGPVADAAPPVRMCEVEMSGTIQSPKGPVKGFVAVSDGDCMAGADPLAVFGTTDKGAFDLEVFVKWASDLTVCAFVDGDAGEQTLYGKAKGPFHAEKEGEVEFRKLVIDMKPGPAKRFSRNQKLKAAPY